MPLCRLKRGQEDVEYKSNDELKHITLSVDTHASHIRCHSTQQHIQASQLERDPMFPEILPFSLTFEILL